MSRTRTEIRKSAFINPQDLFLKAIAVCWANTISMHFSIPSVFLEKGFVVLLSLYFGSWWKFITDTCWWGQV